MKRAALTLLVLTGLATALVLVLLTAALQPEPAVSLRDDISHQDVARVINLLRWHDPRRGAPGRPAVATLSERDIEVLLGHGAQRWLRAASRVSVLRGNAVILVSFHLPRNPFGQWLNVEVQIAETSGLPAALLEQFPPPHRLRLPMQAGQRSLNLSNAVAVTVFEAWRQNGFSGAGS